MVGGILYSTLSAIFLIVPRKILPDLVFGSLFIIIATLKAATGPILSLTIWTHSLEIVSLSLSTPAFKTSNPIGNWPFNLSADKLKGQLPIGLLVLKAGVDKDNETISKECVQMVRDKIGPVAAFKVAIIIKRLPKTRSGKILRGTIRKIADSVEYKMPPTIDDPAILDEIKEDLIKNNILKSA